jgi:hypothetical protein
MPPTSPQEYLQRINTIMGVADTDSDIRMTLETSGWMCSGRTDAKPRR